MDKELASSSTKSDILLTSKNRVVQEEEEEEEEEEEDTKQPKGPELEKSKFWSSRFKCYEAYVCCLSSYSALQSTLLVLSRNGILPFIPSILFRILIGIPAVIIQIMLGRYIMTDLSKSWSMHILAKGILICEITMTCYHIVYNMTATSYLIRYAFLSFSLPWETCKEQWATIYCYESQNFQRFFAKCLERHTREFCKNSIWRLSGTEYWKYVVSNTSNPTSMIFLILSSLGTSVVVFAVIVKGFQSVEKSFILFVIVPLILTPFVTFIICRTPEFATALRNILEVDKDKLLQPKVWVAAYNSMLFILGIGRLPLAFISSRANFEHDIFSEVLVVCLMDILFCLLIALPTSFVTETMHQRDFRSTYCSDSLYVFISLSEMVTVFPFPKYLLASLYYLLLVLLTVGSLGISMLALVQTIIGFAPHHLSYFYMSLALCCFSFFGSFIFFYSNFDFSFYIEKSIVTILFLYLITLELFYGFGTLTDDFHFMMGYPVPFFLKFAWIVSLPTSFMMIIFNAIIYRTCSSSTIVYIFLGLPFLIYIAAASIRIGMNIYQIKTITQISQLCHPEPDWGPADPLYKKSRILFDSRAFTKEFMYRQELQEKLSLKPPDISEQSIVHVI